MSDIDEIRKKIERHLGRSTEIELENEKGQKDKFKINPLPVGKLPELYKLSRPFQNPNQQPEITEEWLNIVGDLGVASLQPNYPDIEESILRELVLRNNMKFATELVMGNLKIGRSDTEKIKARMNAVKEAAGTNQKKG